MNEETSPLEQKLGREIRYFGEAVAVGATIGLTSVALQYALPGNESIDWLYTAIPAGVITAGTYYFRSRN